MVGGIADLPTQETVSEFPGMHRFVKSFQSSSTKADIRVASGPEEQNI